MKVTDSKKYKDNIETTTDIASEEGKWSLLVPPNIPLLTTQLDKEIVKHLWDCIEEAKKTGDSYNDRLAGNISSSLEMKDKDDIFHKHIRTPVTRYVKDFLATSAVSRNIFYEFKDVEAEVCIDKLWVNFQRENEFNPVHEHSGVGSFVVWMDIPTYAKDQHNLPISKRSNNPMASNFVFYYQNLTGEICEYRIFLNPGSKGAMLLFPATLQHCVYPFYDCDKERVSISGNLVYRRHSK